MAGELKPGSVFYDVGANVGLYTLLAATLVAPGRVYAIEPLAANVGYLRKHLALNGIQNAEVLEMAASWQVGNALFPAEWGRALLAAASGMLAVGKELAAWSLDPMSRRLPLTASAD